MHVITLIPSDEVEKAQRADPDKEISPQTGAVRHEARTVGVADRRAVQSAAVGCVDRRGHEAWRDLWGVPLGTTEGRVPF